MIMNRIISMLNILKYRLNPKFIIERQVKIDKNTVLKGHNRICKATKINSSEIGIGTYLGWNCVLINAKIGNYCSIGPNVEVVYGRHPLNSFISTHPAFFSINKQAGFTFVSENLFEEYKLVEGRSVIIGNDVWVGNGVKIMEGVTIGDGAVIGAYSIVTKDIEPFSVNVGVPAKKIKFRFNKETIKLIVESKWWQQDPTKLKEKLEDYDLSNFIIERTYDANN